MFTEDDDMDGPRCHAFSGGAKAQGILQEWWEIKGFAERNELSDDNFRTTKTRSAPGSGRRTRAVVTLLLFLTFTVSSLAQESLRAPITRPTIAGFRPIPGNFIRIGPFGGDLNAGLGVGFNDNYNETPTGKISDWYTFQGLDFDLTWVMSRLNRLEARMGAQLIEDFPSRGTGGLRLSIAPESNLEFQFQVADFRFRVFDLISYTNDPVSEPSTAGTAHLNRFSNTAGTTVDWILHKATIETGFLWTYTNESTTGQIITQANNRAVVNGERNDFRIPSSIIFNFSPTVFYGADVVAIKSTAPGFSDANAINVGGFVRGYLTRLVDIDLHAGVYYIDATSVPPVNWDLRLTLRDQINRDLQAYVSFVREIQFGVGNQLEENNWFYVGTSYNLTRKWNVSAAPFGVFGKQFGAGAEHYNQYGVQAVTAVKLSQRWLGSISYRWVRRNSNLSNRSYSQNEVTCSLNYAF
jgi:hypothetical protein